MSIYENLKKLNIIIPKPPDPVGAYVAYKKTSNLLFISGQISIDANGNITKIMGADWDVIKDHIKNLLNTPVTNRK